MMTIKATKMQYNNKIKVISVNHFHQKTMKVVTLKNNRIKSS